MMDMKETTLGVQTWFPPRGMFWRSVVDWRWWVLRMIPVRLWVEITSPVIIELDRGVFGAFEPGADTIRFVALLWGAWLGGLWGIWRVSDRFFWRYRVPSYALRATGGSDGDSERQ